MSFLAFAKRRVKCAALLSALVIGAGIAPAHAAMFDRFNNTLDNLSGQVLDMVPEGVYGVRLGLGPAVDPHFVGDSAVYVHAVPVISFRYKDLIAVDNNQIRVNFLGTWGKMAGNAHWALGPVIHIDFGRDESDSPKLKGLGNIGTSLEAGAYVAYRTGPLRLRARVRQDITNGHGGMIVDTDANSTLWRHDRWSISGNVRLTWSNSKYMKSFYGISPTQSAASGLPVFQAHASFHDVALNLVTTYDFTERWTMLATLGYSRLLGTAASNPLVQERGSPNQPSAAIFAIYTF